MHIKAGLPLCTLHLHLPVWSISNSRKFSEFSLFSLFTLERISLLASFSYTLCQHKLQTKVVSKYYIAEITINMYVYYYHSPNRYDKCCKWCYFMINIKLSYI